MTPYETWQLEKYGDILPVFEVHKSEPAASTSEIIYAYQLENE